MDFGNLQFAILGLVAMRDDGSHGYRLKKELESLCDDFWQINFGRLYRILDLWDQSGDLSVMMKVQDSRPNRKVYRITEKGERTLDDWLLQPVSDEPRPLRDELSLKLLFLTPDDIGTVADQIKYQRGIYLTRLALIERRRKRLQKGGFEMKVIGLILDGCEMRIQADLAWLDHVERQILRNF